MTRVLRSGWLPAALVVVLAAASMHVAAGVAWTDLARFGAYLLGWLLLPGTLVWRAATRRRGPRPLAEDLALGALTGYVLEFPVYALCLAVGHPRAYLAWPAVILLATLTSRRGRALWKPTGQRMPLAWSWGVSAALGYTVLWFAHQVWGPRPIDDRALRTPYVDEPFHLSIATGLKHFWPPRITYTTDTDLQYHWLSHLHVAASSWVSGVEPVVLLRAVALPVLTLFVVLALAHAAVRLTGTAWVGVAAAASLLISPLAILPGANSIAPEPLLVARIVLSPSAGFVHAALLLAVVLCLDLLRGTLRGPAPWALAALTFAALVGGKSTALPTVAAGLGAAAVVCSWAARRLDRVAVGLTVVAIVVFVAAKQFFFGPGNHGLDVDPFAITSNWGTRDRAQSVVGAVQYLGLAPLALGLLALLLRGGWRRPDAIFLNALCAAGLGAGFVFHQEALSEYYFIYVVFVPMMLGWALGLHRLFEHLPRPAFRVAGIGLGVAAVIGLIAQLVLPDTERQDGWGGVLRLNVLPIVIALSVAVAITVLVVRLARRPGLPARRRLLLPVLAVVLAGLATGPAVHALPDLARDPRDGRLSNAGQQNIGRGGLAAARWLRAHSGTDDVVATNAHCQFPRGTCAPRTFWMAAYAERQILVEGWAYVIWESAGYTSPPGLSTISGPFWNPALLAENDAAFLRPSAETIGRLTTEHRVRWLFVDRRFPADLAGLREHARLRFRSGAYSVFELPR